MAKKAAVYLGYISIFFFFFRSLVVRIANCIDKCKVSFRLKLILMFQESQLLLYYKYSNFMCSLKIHMLYVRNSMIILEKTKCVHAIVLPVSLTGGDYDQHFRVTYVNDKFF